MSASNKYNTLLKTLPLRDTQREPQYDINPSFYIKSLLGSGGAGTVYLGEQPFPKRDVAIKIANPGVLGAEESILQEAMIAGSLEHPSIVPIYAVHRDADQRPRIVMRRISGKTFSTIIKEEHGTDNWPQKAVSLLISVCHALEHAHSRGVVHRDIKSENIMVGSFGEVYLLDWGLAFRMSERDTCAKGLCGSLHNMAPEMLAGNPSVIDEKTDIFLLGATLHEAITGNLRYQGETFSTLRSQIERCERQQYTGVFGSMFTDIINRACAKDPSKRYASVRYFREALEQFLERRQAIILSDLAQQEYQTLKDGMSQGWATNKTFSHFHRSRFAYEQSLEIWQDNIEAQTGLAALLLLTIRHHMKNQELDVVQELLKYVKPIDAEQKAEFERARSAYQSARQERERLQELGTRYDFFPYAHSFVFVVVPFFAILLTIFLLLRSLQNLDPLDVTADILFAHSIFYLLPPMLFLIFGRHIWLKSLAVRRVFGAIFGAILVIVLHRWIAMEEGWLSPQIIAVDLFVLGSGFVSCSPVLRSSLPLAALSFGIGIFNYLFPSTIWTGTIIFAAICFFGIGQDGWRLWNQSGRKAS
ncbi:MAG: serine/threonine-protein kinase [Myxococcota bacterium]|nr:serine/threonine-protein kinase [Myxococcota bacterium]